MEAPESVCRLLVSIISRIFNRSCGPQSNSRLVDFDTLILVGIIQSGLAITAACLPTLGPITSAAFRACTQPREGHRGTRKLRLPTSNIMHQAGYRLYSLGFPALSRASTHRQGLVHDCVSGSSHEGGDVSMPSSRSFNQSPENHDEEIGRETWAG